MFRSIGKCLTIVLAAIVLSGSAVAHAATITFEGTDEATRDAYRTTDASKPLDTDGDNVYGTQGSFKAWQTATNSNPGYATVTLLGSPALRDWWDYLCDVDDADVAPGPRPISNVNSGVYQKESLAEFDFFQIDITQNASFNLTVFTDNDQDWPAESTGALRIRQTVGGTADTGLIDVTGVRDGQADWQVLSIFGAKAGDQFVYSQTTGTSYSMVGGLFFDAPVPEPGTFVLATIGLLGMVLVAWRRRRSR